MNDMVFSNNTVLVYIVRHIGFFPLLFQFNASLLLCLLFDCKVNEANERHNQTPLFRWLLLNGYSILSISSLIVIDYVLLLTCKWASVRVCVWITQSVKAVTVCNRNANIYVEQRAQINILFSTWKGNKCECMYFKESISVFFYIFVINECMKTNTCIYIKE